MQSNNFPQGNIPQQPYGGSQPYLPPMQQGYVQPMPPTLPPQLQPKKPKRWPWIVALFVALMIGYAAGSTSHSSTNSDTATTPPVASTSTQAVQPTSAPVKPTAIPKPTPAPKWTNVESWSGNGQKKTAIFSVPGDWKMNYTCQGFTDGSGIDGAFAVTVYGSDGSIIDPGAIDATCKAGKTTSDSTEEHQAGSIYLAISGTGDWTIAVQALK